VSPHAKHWLHPHVETLRRKELPRNGGRCNLRRLPRLARSRLTPDTCAVPGVARMEQKVGMIRDERPGVHGEVPLVDQPGHSGDEVDVVSVLHVVEGARSSSGVSRGRVASG
jgi:hypothetical protein